MGGTGWAAGVIGAVSVLAGITGPVLLGPPPVVSIEGDTQASHRGSVTLTGAVAAPQAPAVWTTPDGRRTTFTPGTPLVWTCPGVGRWTLSLTATTGTGDQRAFHTVSCF